MKRIRLLLADDHKFLCEAIKIVLQDEGDIDVVGEAATGREAVLMNRRLSPDIILMDIAMPQLNGLEAARQILSSAPKAQILILSGYDDDTYLKKAAAIGVKGFVVKSTSSDLLVKAIRAVAAGKSFFSASVTGRMVHHKNNKDKGAEKHSNQDLTPREMEVLQLLAEGMANKQSAIELGISIKTVEKHRQSLMDKLSIRDTAGLTRYAISGGIIESSTKIGVKA